MNTRHNPWYALLRFGFRLLYNELAWTYDAVSWVVSLGQWREWQRAALPYVRGRCILEIAHGPGHMLLALQEANPDRVVVGLDLSPYMSRMARARLRKARAEAGLLRGHAQDLPLSTSSFDAVLSTFPTEFVVHPDTLAAVWRVLKPGGRFVIVPEGHLVERGPLSRFIEWLYLITGQRGGAFALEDATEPAAEASSGLRQRLEASGFRVRVKHVQFPGSGATVIIAEKGR